MNAKVNLWTGIQVIKNGCVDTKKKNKNEKQHKMVYKNDECE